MSKQTEWATIGIIVALFGIHGELKVRSLTDIPDRFAKLTTVYLGPSYTPYHITGVRPYKGDMVILKLEGIDDATAAETIRNWNLFLPLDKLAKLPTDSYYQHDIIGLHVKTLSGQDIGTITDIMGTGSNDVYIIKAPEGQQILIPAIKEIIKQIDLERHLMYIDPIRGLLDNDAVVHDSGDLTEEEEV
jgi:16S rRNA processing protein RimM